MMYAMNLPIAELAATENNSTEIGTLNPVNINIAVLARIATKEDIDADMNVEMAIPARSISNILPNYENHNNAAAVEGDVETNNIIVPSITNHQKITKFMNTRKYGLTFYTTIFIANLLYIFVNPIGIIFLLNIFFNLFTLISSDIKLIKINITTNISTIICIILTDILFTFRSDTLLIYIVKKEFIEHKVRLYYLITLYTVSISVIIAYLYLTLILNKLRLIYNTFTQHQINIISIILKN